MPFAVEVVDREQLGEVSPPVLRLSQEQYLALVSMDFFADGQDVELLDGWVIQKLSKKPGRTSAKRRLAILLRAQVPSGWLVTEEDPVLIGNSVPEPDVMVVRGSLRQYDQQHPQGDALALVVEVSDSSRRRDKTWKAEIYARAGIPHFWLVNLPESCLELYSNPKDARYEKVTRLTRGEEATVVLEPGPIRVLASDVLPSAE